jgi:parallel beta-helix repeat protein
MHYNISGACRLRVIGWVLGLTTAVWGGACGADLPTAPSTTTTSSATGPQANSGCPVGAINIPAGDGIQNAIDAHGGYTTFCLEAGTHAVTAAITPKTGDIFVGEAGAVLDGSGWTTADRDQGAFGAHSQDIDYVTIRNLVIRRMPQKGIQASADGATGWTIENNEIAWNQHTGVSAPRGSIVRNNHIHHNATGGYSAYRADGTLFEGNEIAFNGSEQKIVGALNVTFRGNFVHDNAADGIWYDTDNTGSLIEGNHVENNGRDGIAYEVSGKAVIRNNRIHGSGGSAILISTSKDVEIHGNILEDNFRGIQYFLNCGVVGRSGIGVDLANVDTSGNTITVGNRSGALANGFVYRADCPATQAALYVGGARNLRFDRNRYTVPSPGRYWMWGGVKNWSEWQAVPQDLMGAVNQ